MSYILLCVPLQFAAGKDNIFLSPPLSLSLSLSLSCVSFDAWLSWSEDGFVYVQISFKGRKEQGRTMKWVVHPRPHQHHVACSGQFLKIENDVRHPIKTQLSVIRTSNNAKMPFGLKSLFKKSDKGCCCGPGYASPMVSKECWNGHDG
jgi:hypothetical protein